MYYVVKWFLLQMCKLIQKEINEDGEKKLASLPGIAES